VAAAAAVDEAAVAEAAVAEAAEAADEAAQPTTTTRASLL
jgi:hypothetical protein